MPEPTERLAPAINPFPNVAVPRQRGWGRFVGEPFTLAARAEIQNLLASRPPSMVAPAEIWQIASRYHLNEMQTRTVGVALFRTAFRNLAEEGVIGSTEAAYLTSLRHTLGVGEDDAIDVEAMVLHPGRKRPLRERPTSAASSPPQECHGPFREPTRDERVSQVLQDTATGFVGGYLLGILLFIVALIVLIMVF